VAVAIVFSAIIPIPLVIQLQLVRSLGLLIILSCVYGAILALYLMRQSSYLSFMAGLVLAILVTAAESNLAILEALGLLLVFIALNLKRFQSSADTGSPAAQRFAGLGALVLLPFILLGSSPGVTLPLTVDWPQSEEQIRESADPWIQVQLWAKEHTPPDAVFVTPFDHSGFRIYSERRPLVEWKEGNVGLFDPEFGFAWRERFQDQIAILSSNHPDLSKFGQFYAKYRFDYLVLYIDWPAPPGWTQVYKNSLFAMYEEPD